jgi:hypothetical protein
MMATWVWLTDDAGQDIRVNADQVTHLGFEKYGPVAVFFKDGKRHDFRLRIFTTGTQHAELAFDSVDARDAVARKITGAAW